jgi:hypothetical protein
MVIEVTRMGTEMTDTMTVEVLDGRNLQAKYDQLVALVMRMGSWLSSPQAQLLSSQEWEGHFARYQTQLERLRTLGDELRPKSLRPRHEPLTGDALTTEVLELFAA